MSANPPGCTERDHDEAFGVAPGYEEFCEEFAAGEHSADLKVAMRIVTAHGGTTPDSRNGYAAAIIADMFAETMDSFRDVCERLSVEHHYDAALKQAWAEHSNPQT